MNGSLRSFYDQHFNHHRTTQSLLYQLAAFYSKCHFNHIRIFRSKTLNDLNQTRHQSSSPSASCFKREKTASSPTLIPMTSPQSSCCTQMNSSIKRHMQFQWWIHEDTGCCRAARHSMSGFMPTACLPSNTIKLLIQLPVFAFVYWRRLHVGKQ